MVLANRERRHGVSIVYLSTGLQVSGYGHPRSGLLINQATTQRWWLVVASCYGTQGNIVICRCVPVVCDSVFALDERGNGSYPVRRLVLHVANRCAELRGSWRQSTWMDFRLLEIDCVILAILGEFILLRQSSVMSSILLINQPVDPWLHSVCS